MVIIPKTTATLLIDKFRYIVLGNFFFKIITKILVDRFSRIASNIINLHQFRFIKGHTIDDCIARASNVLILSEISFLRFWAALDSLLGLLNGCDRSLSLLVYRSL